jgi:RNA polymerase sigma-70 factor (sigma-E family)
MKLTEGALVTEHDLGALYEELWPAMVRLAKLLVGSDAAAEDVAQDAFVSISSRLDRVENPGAYLRAAVVNRAKGVYRRKAVADRHRADRPGVTHDPEVDETWAVLGRLPHRQRAVLVLRFYEDMSEAEIAQTLGWPTGTVKSATHRALARMRKELS